MTNEELQLSFKLELDKTDSLSYPSFLREEIDYWLNKAYLVLINNKMSGNNYTKWDLDASNKRLDDFRKLIVETRCSALTSSVSDNAVVCRLSTLTPTYLYYVSSKSIIRNADNTYSQIGNVIVPSAMKDQYINTTNNIPWIEYPVCYLVNSSDTNGDLVVLYDSISSAQNSWVISDVDVMYIKKPIVIDTINYPTAIPEISEHCHQEIVSLAVNMVLENIESPRSNTNQAQLNKLE